MAANVTNILVPNVDTALLRKQRDWLLYIQEQVHKADKNTPALDGLINLLDEMLDIAEGYGLKVSITESLDRR
jgi:hypothetical protein